jgi:hypothetical protein
MIKTQEKSTKDRVAELREKHQPLFEEIGKPQSYFYPKIAYRPADKDELYVSFFPSELGKGDDIYTEFINRDYNPEDSNRTLWVLKYNPHWREEYEPTQVNDLSTARYLVPVSELTKVNLPKKQEEDEADPFKSLIDFVDDCPISQMTVRDFATIMLGKPISHKPWLNKLITEK